jgi:hypothetical protein
LFLGLIKLRGSDSIDFVKEELDEYEKVINESQKTKPVIWKDFLSLTLFKPLVNIKLHYT